MHKPYIIGVAGPSCSGKTFLTSHLKSVMREGEITVISLDSYYRDLSHLDPNQRAQQNFDRPESLDQDLLIQQMQALSNGETIEKPTYQFTTHNRGQNRERVEPTSFIILEGLFALYWEEIRSLTALKVFIDTEDDICLMRRQDRDIHQRGRTYQSIIEQYKKTVRPMYERYVLPTKSFADIVLSGVRPINRSVALIIDRIEQTNRTVRFKG